MKIAIIGGGPSGCAAAHFAQKHLKNSDITIFEAAPALGGRATTLRKDGWVLDSGASFMTNFYPRLFRIAKERGFLDQIVEMNRISGLAKNGSVAPLDVSSTISFLGFPYLRFFEKMKMAFWTAKMTMKRGSMDLAKPQTLAPYDNVSIEEYALSELNSNIYHSLIRPAIEPFWYFSCAEVSRSLVMGLTAQAVGAKFYCVPKGIDLLCSNMAADAVVKTNCRVHRITKDSSGFVVATSENGNEKTESFDRVVIATTASVAKTISKDLDYSPVVHSYLDSQTYASNIHVGFRIPRVEPPPLVGAIFPCDEENRILAAISFHRVKHMNFQGEEELVSVYLSNQAAKKYLNSTDEDLAAFAWSKLQEYCSFLPNKKSFFSIHRRVEAIPVHEVGRYRLAAEAQNHQKESPIQFCGDYWSTATVEGAIATAEHSILQWKSKSLEMIDS